MSESKSDELHWRETYFILFPQKQRPTLTQVESALSEASDRLQLENLEADDDGYFASLLVESPQDHAAVEISYESGDTVVQQNLEWAKDLQKQLPAEELKRLMTADARLDVAHFERLTPGGAARAVRDPDAAKGILGAGDFGGEEFGDDDFGGDEFGEEDAFGMLDPTCLLTVVDALANLTGGVTFDPASGEMMP